MRRTLVDISLGVVGRLVLLVDERVLAGLQAAADVCVVVLGDVLVGFLGGGGAGALDGLGDVVCCVLELSVSKIALEKVMWWNGKPSRGRKLKLKLKLKLRS